MQVKVGGRSIHCATGGRGFDAARPAVVLLHGAGMDHTCWAVQARWLAWHGWATLVPDLPGHGRSEGRPLTSLDDMASWTTALMDAAGLGEAALIGHSMGGAIALEVAGRNPARVTHLALFGTAASIPVGEALLTAAANDVSAACQMMTEWGHGAGAKMGRNPIPGLWMTGATKALLGRNRPGVLHADLAACNAWTTGAAAAAKVRAPTLVLLAANDVMTPNRHGRALASAVAGARAMTLEDCGHMMMQEAPDACVDALQGFLDVR